MLITKWVLIDKSNGAKCTNGETISYDALNLIAQAVEAQLNEEFADNYGGQYNVRVSDGTDIQTDEYVYTCVATFQDIPGASAYHDEDENGRPRGFCAVTTCASLIGPNGVAQDCSHELLEAGGNPFCNKFDDDYSGKMHCHEVGDPVEVQSYPKMVGENAVYVSNFVLESWFNPKGVAPFDYMCEQGMALGDGNQPPQGPMQIAPSYNGQGNYQIVEDANDNSETQQFGRLRILGHPRKALHTNSRLGKIARKKAAYAERLKKEQAAIG